MQHLHRLMIAAVVAIGFTLLPGAAQAQEPQAVKQIALTEKHVVGFIAAQKDMAPIAEKMQGSTSDKPDPKIQAELDGVAKKHGFAGFAEYDDVAANISMIMAGIDPQTKAFTDPVDAIKKEIAEVQADKSIPAKEKQEVLKELNEALKVAQPVQHRGNIELVKKHYDKIEAMLQ